MCSNEPEPEPEPANLREEDVEVEREGVVHAEGVPAEAVHDPPRRSHVEEAHALPQHAGQQPGVKRLRRLYPAEREAEGPGDVDVYT